MPSDLAIPVVVHYMENPALARNAVADRFPPHVLEKYFLPDGAFNAVWASSNARLVFRLHGLQTSSYSLKDFGYFEEHEELPAPSSDREIFPRLVEQHNFVFGRPSPGVPALRDPFGPVLDLYLFWKISVWAGWAQPPVAKPGKPPRPGAVWIDTDTLGGSECDRLYAHEVGHFLGLPHACRAATQEADPAAARLPDCTQDLDRRLMGPAYEGTLLLDSETGQARARAEQLFGVSKAPSRY